MLIKRRFFNTKVKIVTAVMAVGVIVGGALFTLPMDNAKGVGSPYPPTDSENWNPEPVWRDEFDGNSLDGTKWTALNGGWKDENQQVRNCYTRSDENINVSGGNLNLIGLHKPGATCTGGNTKTGNFTSGFVQTKNKAYFKYGYIEARIKMPKNKSTWPGFWMSPNNSPYGPGWPDWGEIDIVEAKGSNRQFAASDAHWRDKNTPTGQTGSHRNRQGVIPSSKFGTNNDTTEWHTYGVKWTEGKLEYFIDGELHHTITEFKNSNSTGNPNGPFDQDFFLRLNLAIGGNYIDAPWNDAHNSVGAADDFPATMSVDYVRVYEMRTAKEINVPDNNLRKLLNEKLGEKLGTTRTANQKITDVELEKLTDLGAGNNSHIYDITGLEAAKNLQNLSLDHTYVSNLRPLSGLTSLRNLSLTNCSITDISPLAGLTSLTSLHLEDQHVEFLGANDKSFASPLKDLAGNAIPVINSAEVVNDTAIPGNIKLLSLTTNGQDAVLTSWTRNVTIGAVSTTFSGEMGIDTSAVPRTAQPQPQPQPQPGNPSAAAHNPVNKPQNAVSSLLANTGFNAFLGVIATLALVAAGLFILR